MIVTGRVELPPSFPSQHTYISHTSEDIPAASTFAGISYFVHSAGPGSPSDALLLSPRLLVADSRRAIVRAFTGQQLPSITPPSTRNRTHIIFGRIGLCHLINLHLPYSSYGFRVYKLSRSSPDLLWCMTQQGRAEPTHTISRHYLQSTTTYLSFVFDFDIDHSLSFNTPCFPLGTIILLIWTLRHESALFLSIWRREQLTNEYVIAPLLPKQDNGKIK